MTQKQGVVICGFYGNYNLGDEAMLAGMINLLRKQQKDLFFTVFSQDPQDTKTRHSVKSIKRPSSLKIQYFLETLQSRYFVLGGGDLLRDSSYSSIARTWLQPLQKAQKLRRRTLVLGVSVGEIWKPETKVIIPKVLNQVNFIAVRDIKSKSKLEELGVRKTIHLMSDLALYSLPENFSQSTNSINQPPQIGISVRHLSGRGPSVDLDLYPTFLKEMAGIADSLVKQYGAIVHFLPFRTHHNSYHCTDDDYICMLNVFRYSHYSAHFIVHRCFESLQKLNEVISSLDLMIGMRLHSLILSAGLGVPSIAVEYAPKVRGFMEEIDQAHLSIPLHCFEKARLIPQVERILSNPAAARTNLEVGVRHYRQRTATVEKALAQIIFN